jgi:hypothetical protein
MNGSRLSRQTEFEGKMKARKMGRLPRSPRVGEAPHNMSRRIQSTDPHQSHKHEHLGQLVVRGESPVNRKTRERHVGVSGTGQSIGRVVGAQKQKRLDRGVHKII